MRFIGNFVCDKCGKEFLIDLGPVWMKEQKTPKKIGEGLGSIATLLAKSCKEHEKECGQ